VVVTDAIKYVQTERLMSNREDNSKESEEPDFEVDKDLLKGEKEKETGELTNQIF
jgi:hypothetical protein